MPEFEEIQQNAKNFSEKLSRAYARQRSFGSFFCTCFPSIPNAELAQAAYLIQQIAKCLDFYPNADRETKKLVLIGVYSYVWYQYDNTVQWFLNRPLLKLLQQDMKIDSLTRLDARIYNKSLSELSLFCSWVYEESNKFQELNDLYHAFPVNMQGNLYLQKDEEASSYPGWGTPFSHLMIGIKGLF
ncbi:MULTISPECIES: hypothetical protein [unclassified Legionella]|uniref:hypothetical protein n=1 Tax=unclassified Legionella TaxID=2622702 RepID=UPI00105666A3|nr:MULTISPECIES: hypothetical protein [unclassified Legionella]MDI9817664.1 hypothetical protein [Legionella sp. PL877]